MESSKAKQCANSWKDPDDIFRKREFSVCVPTLIRLEIVRTRVYHLVLLRGMRMPGAKYCRTGYSYSDTRTWPRLDVQKVVYRGSRRTTQHFEEC